MSQMNSKKKHAGKHLKKKAEAKYRNSYFHLVEAEIYIYILIRHLFYSHFLCS